MFQILAKEYMVVKLDVLGTFQHLDDDQIFVSIFSIPKYQPKCFKYLRTADFTAPLPNTSPDLSINSIDFVSN
jgi:hypothetical protein